MTLRDFRRAVKGFVGEGYSYLIVTSHCNLRRRGLAMSLADFKATFQITVYVGSLGILGR